MSEVLLPLLMVILLFVGVAMYSKAIMLAGSGGFMILLYVSVQSGNSTLLGAVSLALLVMSGSIGVFFAKSILGETA